jgi:hydrogenase maturation protein HypF
VTVQTPAATGRRVRLHVRGTVQGVGFRPHVFRLAAELDLSGFVFNDSRGVTLEVEGRPSGLESFHSRLAAEAPPLAVIERVLAEELTPTGEPGFTIRKSAPGHVADTPVTPDSATCEDCMAELDDSADRRYRYPFINCTNCGPRFTIVRGVPYDRPLTTMAGFAMCERCRREYEDPADRRFHAQPNACPECGPSLSLLGQVSGRIVALAVSDPLVATAAALRDGAIVAIKGIGGFHLACAADDSSAVAALRARKRRYDKPFALMARSVAVADRLVSLGKVELELLQSSTRPIVLAPRRADAPVANAVAPGSPELGVMLPYSPLHHLLLADFEHAAGDGRATLVMTSGNVSDEPIAFRDDDALDRLCGIADLFLTHDRPIETRTDDSVVRVVSGPARPRPTILRRSRGYVPASLTLPARATRPLLACGAELKSTFCLARDERAWVSHHIGDLQNYETLCSFTDGVEHLARLFAVEPALIAHDLHPEYLSTKYALEREGVDLVGVQHHHAHLAACLAEHGEAGPAVGAIFDGTGYGSDGTVWGGEILYGGLQDFARVGSLLPVRMPGGERAIREPWRMACAWLALAEEPAAVPAALAGRVPDRRWEQVRRLAETGLSSPQTTSMGRLFDAVAALCGLRAEVTYEGQAAIDLEAACDPYERGRYPIEVAHRDRLLIDPRATVQAIAADVRAGVPLGRVASRFHAAVASATVEACASAASAQAVEIVALSGGVFQNRRLLEAVSAGLRATGLRVLVPERLPVNDGGISYGQAAVAAARTEVEG